MLAILCLFIIHIIWLIGTQNFEYGFDKLKALSKFLYLIVFISFIRKEFIQIILSAFIAAMLISEITSYLIFFNVLTPFNNATIEDPVPFMLNHTMYGVVLSITLGASLFLFLSRDFSHLNRFLKIISIVFIVSATVNIFIIASRLGYVLYGIVMMSVLIIHFKKYAIRAFLGGLIVSILAWNLAYNNIDIFQSRVNLFNIEIEKIYHSNDFATSFGARVGFYLISKEVLKDNYLLGVGTGDHIDYIKSKILELHYPTFMTEVISAGAGSGLHSDFLDIFVQFGIVGLFGFLFIFYALFMYEQPDLFLKRFQILLGIIFLINASVQGVLYFEGLSKIFILLLSLTLIKDNYFKI